MDAMPFRNGHAHGLTVAGVRSQDFHDHRCMAGQEHALPNLSVVRRTVNPTESVPLIGTSVQHTCVIRSWRNDGASRFDSGFLQPREGTPDLARDKGHAEPGHQQRAQRFYS